MITARSDSGLASAKSAITTRPAPPGARRLATASQQPPISAVTMATSAIWPARRIRSGSGRVLKLPRNAISATRAVPASSTANGRCRIAASQGEAKDRHSADPGGEASRDQTPRGGEQQ